MVGLFHLATLYGSLRCFTTSVAKLRTWWCTLAIVASYLGMASKGCLREAIEQLRQAVKISPQNPHLHAKLGDALVRINEFDSAIAEVELARHEGSSGCPGAGHHQASAATVPQSSAENETRETPPTSLAASTASCPALEHRSRSANL